MPLATEEMRLFGDLQIRNDPWNVEYGSQVPGLAAEQDESPRQPPVLDIELAPEAWAPRWPAPAEGVRRILFTDGVRRIDHRVIVGLGNARYHGAFGSFAVGAVAAEDGRAAYHALHVQRILAAGIDHDDLPPEVPINHALRYRLLPASDGDDGRLGTGLHKGVEVPLKAIHGAMRASEESLGRELAQDEQVLVLMDGPLSFDSPVRGAAVGYIKQITYFYVPESLHGVLAGMPAGTRTPLFALESSKRFARYSWFIRLCEPAPGDSEFSGLVRLEIARPAVSTEQAVRLADMCTVLLPRFASRRGLDPRAPQNLVPVGALEARLRRELGDAELINRYIRAAIARRGQRA